LCWQKHSYVWKVYISITIKNFHWTVHHSANKDWISRKERRVLSTQIGQFHIYYNSNLAPGLKESKQNNLIIHPSSSMWFLLFYSPKPGSQIRIVLYQNWPVWNKFWEERLNAPVLWMFQWIWYAWDNIIF